MNEVQILTQQSEDAYRWMNKLIDSVPTDKWDATPEGIASNISWQVGHQIISIYYHTIMTTVGHISEIIEKLDLRQYMKMCSFDTLPVNMVGKVTPQTLKEHLLFIQGRSLKIISSFNQSDLHNHVEPTKMPHPVAKTKFEAIDWNVKHTMWHCGQIAILIRVVDKAYDFGLKRTD